MKPTPTPDWTAWSLQFTAGLVAGAISGAVATHESGLAGGKFPMIAGLALAGAGLASWFGDRIWLDQSQRVLPPEEMDHTPATRVASIASLILGCIVALLSFA